MTGTSLIPEVRAVENPRRPLEVVIVGAGLAGLVAAYELQRRGHHAVILEADPTHIGGRVRTLRFEDGLYGEAGAMRIPQTHEITRQYIQEFRLPLRRFVQSNPNAFYYLRGKRERIKDAQGLYRLFALTAQESRQTPAQLWAAAVVKRLAALSAAERADLCSDVLQTEAVRRLDQLSLAQVCQAAGLSDDALELLAVTYGVDAVLHSAATEYLREELHDIWNREFDELVGGADRLPAAFAEHLRSKPRLGCQVTRLSQDPLSKRAAATYLEDGAEKRAEGDFVLCTLPLPVLGRIEVEPPLSRGKQRAIRELAYDSSTKVLALCQRRFWEREDNVFGGGTFTDLPTGITYYPSDNAQAQDPKVSDAAAVLLASYTFGQQARRLALLGDRERSALVLHSLANVHPQLRTPGIVRRTVSWCWDTHRHSGGAFAWFNPGQHAALHRHVIAPEGRIFFAGEHASLSHTWMQGALESGLRAVKEMLTVA